MNQSLTTPHNPDTADAGDADKAELTPALYLIPTELSGAPISTFVPESNIRIIRSLRHIIVENIRTARRFIKRCDRNIDINSITFYELNNHTEPGIISSYLDPLRKGMAVGVMSEAGCPAVADPGASVVAIAQRERLRVVPLVGPSSILMALMASGFNGQGFAFNGYLPIEHDKRVRAIRDLENLASRTGQTQIFIETPYRNNKMIRLLADTLRPGTPLCVARDITDPELELILTMPASKWKNIKDDYDKHPAIFLIDR